MTPILNFFRAKANARHKTNHIGHLRDKDKVWHEDPYDMVVLAKSYFKSLFKANEGSYEGVINVVYPKIIVVDNATLLMDFSKDEFMKAIFQMASDKATMS